MSRARSISSSFLLFKFLAFYDIRTPEHRIILFQIKSVENAIRFPGFAQVNDIKTFVGFYVGQVEPADACFKRDGGPAGMRQVPVLEIPAS